MGGIQDRKGTCKQQPSPKASGSAGADWVPAIFSGHSCSGSHPESTPCQHRCRADASSTPGWRSWKPPLQAAFPCSASQLAGASTLAAAVANPGLPPGWIDGWIPPPLIALKEQLLPAPPHRAKALSWGPLRGAANKGGYLAAGGSKSSFFFPWLGGSRQVPSCSCPVSLQRELGGCEGWCKRVLQGCGEGGPDPFPAGPEPPGSPLEMSWGWGGCRAFGGGLHAPPDPGQGRVERWAGTAPGPCRTRTGGCGHPRSKP